MSEKQMVALVVEGVTYQVEQRGEALCLPENLRTNPAAIRAAGAWWREHYGHQPQECGWCHFSGRASDFDGYNCPVCGGS